MKKLLLGMLMLLCLVSCGSGPNDTVSKFINNIKAGKPKEAAKYAIDDGFEGNLEITYTNKTQELLFKTLLKNLEYKIIGTEKQDNDTTIVTVEVTNLDVQKVFLQVFQKISQEVFTNKDSKVVVTAENIDVLLGKLNTTLLNLGNLGKTENETAVELPETGPSTGVSQKPEELRNQNK